MMKADNHVYSKFSQDSRVELKDIAKSAKEKGISYESDGMNLLLNTLESYNQDASYKGILEENSFDYKLFADPDKIEVITDYSNTENIKQLDSLAKIIINKDNG